MLSLAAILILLSPAADTLHPAPMPGLAPLHPVLGDFHLVMDQRPAGDSVWHQLGEVHATRATASGRITNIAVYTWRSGKQTVDTTISLIETLAPVSERTRTPSRIVSYDFNRLHSTGRIGPDSALQPIDDVLPRPAFNSTDLDMIVTGLPLGDQFHASIPLYDPEFPGFRMAELKVTGVEHPPEAAGRGGAWVLSVEVANHPTMFYRIDVTTRHMLEKDFGDPARTAFRVREVK